MEDPYKAQEYFKTPGPGMFRVVMSYVTSAGKAIEIDEIVKAQDEVSAADELFTRLKIRVEEHKD